MCQSIDHDDDELESRLQKRKLIPDMDIDARISIGTSLRTLDVAQENVILNLVREERVN